MKEVLIVDGYNVIGAWPELVELKRESLELARTRLLGILKEYQGYTGMQVVVVFDAHMISEYRPNAESGSKISKSKFQVLYSKQQETADELIERIVYEMEKQGAHIFVATSDMVEQQITFGEGALRISARELLQQVREAEKAIKKDVKELDRKRNTLGDHLDKKVAEIFEKWRRKS